MKLFKSLATEISLWKLFSVYKVYSYIKISEQTTVLL